jgi:hypothetical protein
MDVDPSSVNGETELNAYMRVHQVSNDTDPLMWWNQYLVVIVSSVSTERLFNSVGLVKSNWWGSLLDTTLNKHPKLKHRD